MEFRWRMIRRHFLALVGSLIGSILVTMTSKLDYKNLEPKYSIKPHELAFLVREYLKQQGCTAAVAAFLQEHPPATRGQHPQNKKSLSLKSILDKYLEMKHREEKQEQLVKELTETNKMLRRLVTRLEATGGGLVSDMASETASMNGEQYNYVEGGGMYGQGEEMEGRGEENKAKGSLNQDKDDFQGTYAQTYQQQMQSGENQPGEPMHDGVVNNAVRTLMKNPNLVNPITDRLNEVIAARISSDGNGYNPNNDSMYEQVMGSELVEQLLDQLIPPIPLHDHHHHHNHHNNHHLDLPNTSNITTYDFSEAIQGSQTSGFGLPANAQHVGLSSLIPSSTSPPSSASSLLLPHSSSSSVPTPDLGTIRSQAPLAPSNKRSRPPRSHPSSTLLGASTQHPSIHIKTVASPSTPQFALSSDLSANGALSISSSLVSSPLSPNPSLPSHSLSHSLPHPPSSSSNPKKRSAHSPDAPSAKKRKDR